MKKTVLATMFVASFNAQADFTGNDLTRTGFCLR